MSRGTRGPAGRGARHDRLLEDERLNHRCLIVSGVLAEPCGQILTQFFQQQRRLEALLRQPPAPLGYRPPVPEAAEVKPPNRRNWEQRGSLVLTYGVA